MLPRHSIHFHIALRRNAKGIGHSIEESEHCSNVHRFGYLWLGPAMIPKSLYVLCRGAVCSLCDLGDIFEKNTLSMAQASLVELAFCNRLYCLLFGSLNPQEVDM
jgi:hypothetical protein